MSAPRPFRIIAHRGASGYAPENTMAAFRKAADMGAVEIETDVHFTADGRLVLLHDHTLDRTTDGSGAPSGFSLEQLKGLDAGSWFDPAFAGEPLISLDELLAALGDAFTCHVELKDRAAGIGRAAAEVIARHGLAGRCFVTRFDDREEGELLAARRAAPALRTASLLRRDQDLPAAIEAAARAGHDAVSLAVTTVTRDLVDAGHALGLEVRCYAIAERAHVARAVDAGCDGMTVNWPDWVPAP